MKIAHCFFTMETGGAQVLAVDLLNQICQSNQVLLIIVNNQYNPALINLVDKKIKVIFLKRKRSSKNPVPLIRLNYLLFQFQPDIIHCHEPNMARIIKGFYSKLIYTIHDVGIPTTSYHLYKKIVAISDTVYNDVNTRYPSTSLTTVYNGIPNFLFHRRTDYLLSLEEPIRIVQVSRLMHTKKGQDIVIMALHKLKIEGGFSNFKLDLIGEGESYNYLQELIAKCGLEKNISLIGEKDRNWLYSNLSSYHLLVQPSRYEGFGLTILEGIASGLPVLTSNIDGPLEIIKKTKKGFVFTVDDIESCLKELVRIFDLYKNKQMSTFMKGKEPPKDVYSIVTCAKSYMKEYLELSK